MNGHIPVAGKSVPGCRVPPIVVEAAVGEAGQLGEEVEDRFPDEVEDEDVERCEGEDET